MKTTFSSHFNLPTPALKSKTRLHFGDNTVAPTLAPAASDQVLLSHQALSRKSVSPPTVERRILLSPSAKTGHEWESRGVFNPAVIRLKDGGQLFFYRADGPIRPETPDAFGERGESHSMLGMALLQPDGTIKRFTHPLLSFDGDLLQRFPHGARDPRLTVIDGKAYIVVGASNCNEEILGNQNGLDTDLSEKITGSYVYLLTSDKLSNLTSDELLKSLDKGTDDLVKMTGLKHVGKIGSRYHDKTALFFPEKISAGGKEHFALFHRIMPSIEVTLAKTIEDFQDDGFWAKEDFRYEGSPYPHYDAFRDAGKVLMEPTFPWEGIDPAIGWAGQIGNGAPPIRIHYSTLTHKLVPDNASGPGTEEAWLFLYNSQPEKDTSKRYIGVALLKVAEDGKSLQVMARPNQPLMKPELPEEENAGSSFPGNVFATSALKNPDGKTLDIYYGAGDGYVAEGKVDFAELVNYALSFDAEGKHLGASLQNGRMG